MPFLNLLDRIGIVIASEVSKIRHESIILTYEVTGISPQSKTVAQELNGFASSGTLYPPLNRILREPFNAEYVSVQMTKDNVL